MAERLALFLPSIIILTCIALVTFIYLKLVVRRFGENLKSVVWCEKNQRKVIFYLAMPAQVVWAPVAEELIVRAPLIVIFPVVSGYAWIGIIVSSVIFASVHYFGKKTGLSEVFEAKECGNTKTDNLDLEVAALEKTHADLLQKRRVTQVTATFLLGMLSGYCGILYQSIWVSVGIHAAWNLFLPAVLQLFILLVLLAYEYTTEMWNKFRRRRRNNR